MRLNFLFLGRTREPFLAAGVAEYLRRLRLLAPVSEVVLKAARPEEKDPARAAQAQARDSRKLLEACRPGEKLVLFDLKGRPYSSEQWAGWLKKQMELGTRGVSLALGGPLGLDRAVIFPRADLILTLGPFTLTHEMARLVAAEQTYRALMILKGWPYHK